MIGIRLPLIPPPAGPGWAFDIEAAAGYRYYDQEPYENVEAAAHGIIARAAIGATRWSASGLGLELRLASHYTVPLAWAHSEQLASGDPSGGFGVALSVGLARRW